MHYSRLQYIDERRKLGRRNSRFKKEIARRTRGHCAYCGVVMKKQERTFDHVLPVSAGGSTVIGNLVLSCFFCNQKKGNCTLDEFRKVFTGSKKDRWGGIFWFEYKGIDLS